MMISRIKIWHWSLFLWSLILVFKFERVMALLQLLFSYLRLLFTSFEKAFIQLNIELLDPLISIIIFLTFPLVLLKLIRNKNSLVHKRIFFSGFLLIIISFAFLFSPVISKENPDHYKDIAITRLLKPMSTIGEIKLKAETEFNKGHFGEFLNLKKDVIKPPFDDRIIYCDSAFTEQKSVIYYQKSQKKMISLNLVESYDNQVVKSKTFILGTDEFGRDIFTRLLYGTRLSLFIGFCAVLISFVLGGLLGFIAGYKSGWIDLTLNRLADLFLAFPVIFFVIFILALFGNNMTSIIVVLGFSGWMSLFKLVKSEVSTIKKKDFFISAVMLGTTKLSLMKNEILPLILASIIVNLVFQFGNVILAESALSYLGLGLGNDYPSWGSMIQSGQEYIYHSWWMIVLPGFTLVITLLTINSLGKKIQEFYNPRIKND